MHSTIQEPIAIIGSGCRFPGDACSPEQLWDLLNHPRDVLSPIPAERFHPDAFFHPDGQHHGSTHVKHAYLLNEDVRQFDRAFFSMHAAEAEAMDPQHRLLLETVYESLESAGTPVESLRGSDTAVYVGLMRDDYQRMLHHGLNTLPTYEPTGNARSMISNRISYTFGWHGPSMTIDTACSSSLVSLHLAVQALRSGDTQVAIAAGSNLLLGPEPYITATNLKMLSPHGRCHMWDHRADGYGRGEGVAAVVLKPLSAALRDGDHLECIVRESWVNQDGSTPGITVPSADAQIDLIRRTYSRAGLDPLSERDRCQYFEAHGTGTQAGDPIEAEAINTAFFESVEGDAKSLHVGSVKTILGHTEGTAGLAGVIKASLALQKSIIPANLLFEKLNPKIMPHYRHLQLVTSATPWPQIPDGAPRRASVNSFGFGGTNAHIILEHATPVNQGSSSQTIGCPLPFIFSANNPYSLQQMLGKWYSWLEGQNQRQASFQNISWTLAFRRSRLSQRLLIIADSYNDLKENIQKSMQQLKDGSTEAIQVSHKINAPRILGVFTGQGAQWPQMGRQLLLSSKYAKTRLDELQAALDALPERDQPSWTLYDEIMTAPTDSRVGDAILSQPLCTALQIILVDLLHKLGINLFAVVGHSSGELGAAYAAGVLSAEAALQAAYYRGRHSHLAAGPNRELGAMLAVGSSFADADTLCETFNGRIQVAAHNSATSVTLSGDDNAIVEAEKQLTSSGVFNRRLRVNRAYHSHHMLKCEAAYRTSLIECGIKFQSPPKGRPQWYSTVNGGRQPVNSGDLTEEYWVRNLLQTVRFSHGLEAAIEAKGPFDFVLEVGPHSALKGPAKEIFSNCSDRNPPYFGLLNRGDDDVAAFLRAVGNLAVHFDPCPVNMKQLYELLCSGRQYHLATNLPTYPWDHREAYWCEAYSWKIDCSRPQILHDLLGRQTPQSTENQRQWQHLLRPKEIPWLHGHRLQGQTIYPAAAYAMAALEAAMFLANGQNIKLVNLSHLKITRPLIIGEDERDVEVLISIDSIQRRDHTASARFTYHAGLNPDSNAWDLMAQGYVEISFSESILETLPAWQGLDANLINVETEEFYESLREIGYDYSGPFRALDNLRRKRHFATGDINHFLDVRLIHRSMLHPAVLDAAFTTIMLAFCYPRDGDFWTIHLPTTLRSLTIDVEQCYNLVSDQKLHFQASSAIPTPGGFNGDVSVFSDGERALLQVQSLHLVPLTTAASSNDQKLFFKTVWGPLLRYQTTPENTDDLPASEQHERALLAERVSYAYQRRIDAAIPADHPARKEGPYVCLFKFYADVHSKVCAGKHPWLVPSDANGISIDESKRTYPDLVDFEVLHIVGERMAAVIHGETTILEHLMAGHALKRCYIDAMGISGACGNITTLISQLVHRYPQMNVLEIGAGTGGATEYAFNGLKRNFLNYTYTDVSLGFFDDARERFLPQASKMTFKILNIEQDPTTQSFSECSYDLILASLVLHATADLKRTLQNVRRLLKPGGYLVMLEITNNEQIRVGSIFGSLPGWWLGADDGRELSPCVGLPEWETLLSSTGFAGLDAAITADNRMWSPYHVICAQATDPLVEKLRNPLSSEPSEKRANLIVVGGKTATTGNLCRSLFESLQRHFKTTQLIKDWSEFASYEILDDTVVLSLADLDKPVFKDIKPTQFEALRNLCVHVSQCLWITTASSQDPFASMINGFSRTILHENHDIRFQIMTLGSQDELGADGIARHLIEFIRANDARLDERSDEYLWSVESQLYCNGDFCMIPRVQPDWPKNSRWNSHRRLVTEKVPLEDIYIRLEGERLSINQSHDRASQRDSEFCVQTRYSCSSAWIGSAGAGVILGVRPGTNETWVGVSNVTTSVARLTQWIQPRNETVDEPSYITRLAISLSAHTLLDQVPDDHVILLLGTDKALANAVVSISERSGRYVIDMADQEQSHIRGLILHSSGFLHGIQKTTRANNVCVIDVTSSAENQQQETPRGKVYILEPKPFFTLSCAQREKILQEAVVSSRHLDMATYHQVNISSLSETKPLKEWTIVDWTKSSHIDVTAQPMLSRDLFSDDKTYWLIGLTGDLGLSLVEWMIECGARYFALSSRKPVIHESWLRKVEVSGAHVKVVPADVTIRESLRSALEKIKDTMPAIGGVCQAAMVLDDAPLKEMSFEQLQRVLLPKVKGSIYLDELFSQDDLEFFVYWSSIATSLGNYGQANYAAANSFMLGLAANRRSRGLVASSIDISTLLGVGYVTANPQVLKILRRKGVHAFVSEAALHTAFAEAIIAGRSRSTEEAEIIMKVPPIRPEASEWTSLARNPTFSHCVYNDEVCDSTGNENRNKESVQSLMQKATSRAELWDVLSGKSHPWRISCKLMMKEYFATKLRNLFRMDLDTPSILAARTDSLGVDSLIAVEIRDFIKKDLGFDVPVLKILGDYRIESLLEDVLEKIPTDMRPLVTDVTPQPKGDRSTLPSFPHSQDDQSEDSATSSGKLRSSSPSLRPLSPASSVGLERKTSSTPETVSIEPEAPLAYTQSPLWFLHHFVQDPSILNTTAQLRLIGPLDVARFEKAVAQVIRRHDILHTSFRKGMDGQPKQVILSSHFSTFVHRNISALSDLQEEFETASKKIFALEEGETVQVTLLTESAQVHHLIVSCHHIAVDGTSGNILVRDICLAYNDRLPACSLASSAEFALEQQNAYTKGHWSEDIAFWKEEFSSCPPTLPILQLSHCTDRKPLTSYRLNETQISLDTDMTQKVRSAAQNMQITPFQLYLAVYQALLYRWSGEVDICIGIADNGRREKFADDIGCFMNIIPIRLPVKDYDFARSARCCREKVIAALQHGAVPFEIILGELKVLRTPTQHPLVQAFLNYRRQSSDSQLSLGDCNVRVIGNRGMRTNFDLSVDIDDFSPARTVIKLMGQSQLYSADQIDLLLWGFKSLLDEFLRDSSTSILTPRLFPTEVSDKMIRAGLGPVRESKWPATLSERIDEICVTFPTKVAAYYNNKALTYRELLSRANAIAAQLVKFRKGIKIAVFQEPSIDCVCSLVAIFRVGGVYVPLDVSTPATRLATMVKDCQTDVILTHEATHHRRLDLAAYDARVINVSEIGVTQDHVHSPSSRDAPIAVFYTSGSTGTPKGIVICNDNLHNTIEWTPIPIGDETILQQSSLGFDMSLWQMLISMCYGGSMYIPDHSLRGDAKGLSECIVTHGITLTMATPSEHSNWLRYGDLAAIRGSDWKLAVVGGEPFTGALIESLQSLAKSGLRAYNSYGPTETTILASSEEVHYQASNRDQVQITAGKAMPNTMIYIVDTYLQPLPLGVRGEVAIGGIGVGPGYLGRDDLTEAAFFNDNITNDKNFLTKGKLHRSGDIGWLDADGRLHLGGRIAGDTQVKLRGMRIDLREVESALRTASSGLLGEVVVSRRRDENLETDFLVAFVTTEEGYTNGDLEKFSDAMASILDLPYYMLPSRLISIDNMPLNASGKTDRRAINALPLPELDPAKKTSRNLTDIERRLFGLWVEALPRGTGKEIIERSSDFFYVGGNSTQLIQLQSLIHEAFGTDLPLIKLFERSTLQSMANLLENSSGPAHKSSINWDQETEPDLPPLSQRGDEPSRHFRSSSVVILTGATGLLGNVLLKQLEESASYRRIDCVAVRSSKARSRLGSEKVVAHGGDLSLPLLGLGKDEAHALFSEADVIIHCGADVSHLKSYHSLRAANVQSTKELVALALPYHIPVHYISSTGVGTISSEEQLFEDSVSAWWPKSNTEGYNSTKWASERYLERVQEATGLPITIHRPTTIVAHGGIDANADSDVIQALIKYSKLVHAVPKMENVSGEFNFVSVDDVASAIIGSLSIASEGLSHASYTNHFGELSIPCAKLREHIEMEVQTAVEELDVSDWLDRATAAGLGANLAAFFKGMDLSGGQIYFSRVCKGVK